MMTTQAMTGSNFFMVPVALIDVLPLLSLAEIRTALYTCRHTWGFLEFLEAKRITTDEYMYGRKRADGSRMDDGTGLSKQSVLTGQQKNIKRGIIIKEGEGFSSSYRLNFAPPKVKELDQNGQNSRPPKVKELDQNGQNSRPPKEKETQKEESLKYTKKDSARSRLLSSFPLLNSSINFNELRQGAWSAETILALSSKILDIPDLQSVEESGGPGLIEAMYQYWIHPAQWLFEEHQDLDPRYAWERIERHLRGMTAPDSPSWWVKERARKSPITLRHVVGFNKKTGMLNGSNWRAVRADLEKHAWYPNEVTPYDGPPLTLEDPPPYAQGYTGVADSVTSVIVTEAIDEPEVAMIPQLTNEAVQSGEEAAESIEIEAVTPITEEVAVYAPQPSPPQRQRGMDAQSAEQLAAWLLEDYPQLLIPGFRRVTPDLWAVVVSIGPDQHIDVRRPGQWYDPSERMLPLIEQALIYGAAQCAAMNCNENSSEVDAAEVGIAAMEGG